MKEDIRLTLLNGDSSRLTSSINHVNDGFTSSSNSKVSKTQKMATRTLVKSCHNCNYLGRLASVRRWIVLLVVFSLLSMIHLSSSVSSIQFHIMSRGPRSDPYIHCSSTMQNGQRFPVQGFPLHIHTNVKLKDAEWKPDSHVLRITREGEKLWGPMPGNDWTVFSPNHSTYEPLIMGSIQIPEDGSNYGGLSVSAISVLRDRGEFNGIQRIFEFFFGSGTDFFLLDAMSFLSHGRLLTSLQRYLQVVGQKGLIPRDVESIIETKKRMRNIFPGFRFKMGFSGKLFNHGTEEKNKGDIQILERAREFTWCNELWNIRVTSTEDYPYLRPARLGRETGFIHRKLMVLPRLTCGLYTHTIFIDKYPGGRLTLKTSIRGGEIFQTTVLDRINIFMTHMSNYGNDRTALYTFEAATRFLQCWTNLQLQTIPALQL